MAGPDAEAQQQQPPSTAEDEALKRNTDCVYFLASPLTCKKGSECEYRHSEYARVNSRDCYYWLNGNCLNPKCGFRHPPLDGLFGNQGASSAGSNLPSPRIPAVPAVYTPYTTGKQPVPCIYFQKGLCLRGDRCAFMHGPNPSSNKVLQPTAPGISTESAPHKKDFGGLQKSTQEHKVSQPNSTKVVDVASKAKSLVKVETAPPRNNASVERTAFPHKSNDDEVPRYKAAILPSVMNGNTNRSNRLHHSQSANDHGFQNGKDGDDLLRESSPGFDVLVDDELGDSDYYHREDHYDRGLSHEGRNPSSIDNYDMQHSADYNSMAAIDRESFRDPRSFDSYDHMQGYALEQHRVSSERMLIGATHPERGGYLMFDSPERTNESDLRYRLSKQRRVNGLRSVVSHDFVQDNRTEEGDLRGSSWSHHLHDSSISDRLRGRIKLPGRSSNSGIDLHAEREMERGRNRGRLSPGRARVPQGRIRDRLKGRVEEDYSHEGRNFRGHRMSGEPTDDRSANFAAPKSLAELKVAKSSDDKIQPLGKRKYLEDPQFEGDLSFEGPLPLSEILKRKRETEVGASGSADKDDSDQKENKASLIGSSNNLTVAQTSSALSIVSKDETNIQVPKGKGESGSATIEDIETVDGNVESSLQPNPNEFETEDGVLGEEGMEDHEYDAEDHGDYEYEQVDEGDYTYVEGEEEYVDDEDGDDFAKKIGVMLS